MVKRLDDLEYDLLSEANQNKYAVFEEVRSFLDSNGIFWEHMFQLLRKSSNGYLNYSFGDIEISLSRTEGFCEENDEIEDVIQLSVESHKGNLDKTLTYEYKIKELSKLGKMRQSGIDSFGE
jgi:hypothetical protein